MQHYYGLLIAFGIALLATVGQHLYLRLVKKDPTGGLRRADSVIGDGGGIGGDGGQSGGDGGACGGDGGACGGDGGGGH